MKKILFNARVLSDDGELIRADISVENGFITSLCAAEDATAEAYDLRGAFVMPGAVDVHAHLREPGFEYKETVLTGTRSAAKGGITALMAMPNLDPVPDSREHLKAETDIIARDAVVAVYPFGAVTVGERGKELADLEGLAPYVRAFSDDGRGVNDAALLKKAMLIAKKYGKIIASHAEKEGYGTSPEAEIYAVESELKLVRETGCKYHFCHLSTAKSWAMVRAAKRAGLDVTAEVTPHHLFLSERFAPRECNFKMNPPLRSYEDMRATVTAVLDGTADMIATDHAPHSREEKRDYDTALNGIIGFETMLPSVYTGLVRTGRISFRRFVELTVINPARRFGLPVNAVAAGERADLTALDTDNPRIYTAEEILSKSVNSPFIGTEFYGFPIITLKDGETVYKDTNLRRI